MDLVDLLRSGKLEISDYLREIEMRFENREPELQAFLPETDRFARLRRDTEHLLVRFPRAEMRPPLFGVPIGVKDIFHVAGFTTRAGSRVPAEMLQGEEAECVQQLRRAGALVLGKTVTTEFAYFAPGPTRNPRNSAHTPGGSSSGSAAAVGAGICPLALGTQTIGSIIRPASFCGVVGFKPSFGRVSTAGVIALSPSFDHVGFFVRSVADAEWVAPWLCRDWQPAANVGPKPILGIPKGPYIDHASREMRSAFDRACGKLAGAGFTLKPVAVMSDFERVRERHYLIVNAEAARAHRDWFPRFRDCYHAKTVGKLELGRGTSDDVLSCALKDCAAFIVQMRQRMEEHAIDVWLSPAAIGPAPAGLDSTGDPVMNLPWTQLGFPSLTLPMAEADGLPVGLQLSADRDRDEKLLAWAREIEAALGPA